MLRFLFVTAVAVFMVSTVNSFAPNYARSRISGFHQMFMAIELDDKVDIPVDPRKLEGGLSQLLDEGTYDYV
jgi:hypothetical protein